MRTPPLSLAEKVSIPGALALVAAVSGLWAMSGLSVAERQGLLVAAGVAVVAACAMIEAHRGASPRGLAGALFLGGAGGIAIGIDGLGIGEERLDAVIWIGFVVSFVALTSTISGNLICAASALVLAAVTALGSIGDNASPTEEVQVLAAGCATLALAIGISIARYHSTLVPVGMLLLGASVSSVLAAVRAERIWTTTTLLLLVAGLVLKVYAPTHESRSRNPGGARPGYLLIPALEFLAVASGAASILLIGGLDESSFTWAAAGAVGVGLCGVGLIRFQHEHASRARVAGLERAASESRIDSLTQLANRRGIEERLADEIARARRFGHPLSVLSIDVDDFKLINDRHGHVEGDRALRHLGAAIEQSIRSIDAAGRFGGEEFLVLLPESDLAGATVVAERIRAAAEASGLLTVSIGAAALERANGSTNDLLADADAALYSAKRNGKNRTQLAG